MAGWKVTIRRDSSQVFQSISACDGDGFAYVLSRPSDSTVQFSINLSNGAASFVAAAIAARNEAKIAKVKAASETAAIEAKFIELDV